MIASKQIANYLEDNGIGTVNANSGVGIFISKLPEDLDECVSIVETSGQPSSQHEPTISRSIQIMVRSKKYTTGLERAEAIRELLHHNDDTTNGDYHWLSGESRVLTGRALQEPYLLRTEENGRRIFVTNYNFLIHN